MVREEKLEEGNMLKGRWAKKGVVGGLAVHWRRGAEVNALYAFVAIPRFGMMFMRRVCLMILQPRHNCQPPCLLKISCGLISGASQISLLVYWRHLVDPGCDS